MNLSHAITDIESMLGYQFANKNLAMQALTHASLAKDGSSQFERLEFLGDRILGLVVAELLLKEFGSEAEGEIAVRHAALVSKNICARLARVLNLHTLLQAANEPGDSELADAFEALIAAVYQDGGLKSIYPIIEKLYVPLLTVDILPPKDPKSALQEWAQSKGRGLPLYKVISQSGPDHSPHFEVSVSVIGYGVHVAEGASKKEAERNAAQKMLDSLHGE